MSHSSKSTFKDKGFLFCKLQLTAFNSPSCSSFPSSCNDSDDFFLLAPDAAKQIQEMETFMTNGEMSWVARDPTHTKTSKNLEVHYNPIQHPSHRRFFLICQIVAPSLGTRHGILCDAWMQSSFQRCETYPGSQTVTCALIISILFLNKSS